MVDAAVRRTVAVREETTVVGIIAAAITPITNLAKVTRFTATMATKDSSRQVIALQKWRGLSFSQHPFSLNGINP